MTTNPKPLNPLINWNAKGAIAKADPNTPKGNVLDLFEL
jgi:hypothetical protein